LEETVRILLAPVVEELGVDLLDVQISGGHWQKYLKIVIDQAGGVSSTTLEGLSRALSLQLDAEDLFKGSFRLEVSSPGFDWPLRSSGDFLRHKGAWLKVVFVDGRVLEGKNLGPSTTGFFVQDEQGTTHDVTMIEVAKAIRGIAGNGSMAKKRNKKRS